MQAVEALNARGPITAPPSKFWEQVTAYEAMTLPPFVAGADQVTVAAVLLVLDAMPAAFVGAPGAALQVDNKI